MGHKLYSAPLLISPAVPALADQFWNIAKQYRYLVANVATPQAPVAFRTDSFFFASFLPLSISFSRSVFYTFSASLSSLLRARQRKGASNSQRDCLTLGKILYLTLFARCAFRGAVNVPLARLIFPSEDLEALRAHSCPLVLATALAPSPPSHRSCSQQCFREAGHVTSPSVYEPIGPFRQLDVFSLFRHPNNVSPNFDMRATSV